VSNATASAGPSPAWNPQAGVTRHAFGNNPGSPDTAPKPPAWFFAEVAYFDPGDRNAGRAGVSVVFSEPIVGFERKAL
jgi:hypothetical protein